MGGIKHDPPSDEDGTMARGDCCLQALLNPALAGEAGATVVAAAAEGATGWWGDKGIGKDDRYTRDGRSLNCE